MGRVLLRVASRREVQGSQQPGKALRASTRPEVNGRFPAVDILAARRLALDASVRRRGRGFPGVGIVPMPVQTRVGRSRGGSLWRCFIGRLRNRSGWRRGDRVANVGDVQPVCLGQRIL
jgi:hypothetical protein